MIGGKGSVGRLGEWGLLRRYLPQLGKGLSRKVLIGPGDDAAVFRVSGHKNPLVMTTDTLIEGVHFETRWTGGEDLGRKAVAVNLSDLAAMGDVKPGFGVVTLGITPKTPVEYVDNFHRGLVKTAKFWGFQIVGGDTVRSPQMVVSLTALGWLGPSGRLLRRTGARKGDWVLVSGPLGDAAAGLEILQKKGRKGLKPFENRLVSRFLRPTPRLDLAKKLARTQGVNSLLDCSDGFWRSMDILTMASRVGAQIEAEAVPQSTPLRLWCQRMGQDVVQKALTGGEDFELILTARPSCARRLVQKGLVWPVGKIVDRREGLTAFQNAKKRRVSFGYDHFA